jgi:hypothetical protein
MRNKKISTSIAYSVLLFSFVMPILAFFNYKVDEMVENNVLASTEASNNAAFVRMAKNKKGIVVPDNAKTSTSSSTTETERVKHVPVQVNATLNP